MLNRKFAKDAVINVASKAGLGILRVVQLMLIAGAFGATGVTDAYNVARWLPLLVWQIGDTVLLFSLVPYLASISMDQEPDGIEKKRNQLFSWYFLISLGAAGFVFLLAPVIVPAIVPGFSDEIVSLCIKMLRWLSPSIFLGAVAAFYTSILYSKKLFFPPAVVTLVPPLCVIFSIVFFSEALGIMAPIGGFLAGMILQFFALAVVLAEKKILPSFYWREVKETLMFFRRLGPRVGGVLLSRSLIALDRFFASMLASGSISILAYSIRLAQLPNWLFVASLGKTIMPTWAEAAAQGRKEDIEKLLPRFMAFVLFCLAPVVLIMIFYRVPIVTIIYERGLFASTNTLQTADVLVFYAIAVLFQSMTTLIAGIFFAFGDTWTPFTVTSLSFVLNGILDFVLVRFWGIKGIALATLGVSVTSMIILYSRLKGLLPGLSLNRSFPSFLKIVAATAVMAGILSGLDLSFNIVVESNARAVLIFKLILLSAASWSAFVFVCRILKLEELSFLKRILTRRTGLSG